MNESGNRWVVKADLDFRSAEHLNTVNELSEIVCFHCQQAVEKYREPYPLNVSSEPDILVSRITTRRFERKPWNRRIPTGMYGGVGGRLLN